MQGITKLCKQNKGLITQKLENSQYCDKYIQGVPGGMCQTSGECSLGQTIPI